MAFAIAALAGKYVPTVLSYAPSVLDAAIRLYQSSQNAEAQMVVPTAIIEEGSKVDPSNLSAAIKDIEGSLLILNGQVTDAGLLLTKLAESNAALAQEVKVQRGWLVALGGFAATSLIISLFAFAALLI